MPSYRERVDAALRGEFPEDALDVASAAFHASLGDLRMVWGDVVEYLAGMPAAVRARLLAALPGRLEQVPSGPGLRHGLLYLCVALSQNLPVDILADERCAAVESMGEHWILQNHTYRYLARAEVAAGRGLPVATVATVRRTAQLVRDRDWLIFAGSLRGPALNVGELWADTALAETAALGEAWPALLAHAGSVNAAEPSARWEKVGRTLLEALGECAVRTLILSWLAMVGRPRTRPLVEPADDAGAGVNERLDPINVNAVQGLINLLSFTRADEDSTRALVRLVSVGLRTVPGHGPRSAKLAQAAVIALARQGDPISRMELSRLATWVSHQTTRRVIDAAVTQNWT